MASQPAFTYPIGARLTQAGAPSIQCTVKTHKPETDQYEVHYAGAPDWTTVARAKLDSAYRLSTDDERIAENEANDPEPPGDPDFDGDGMPIYRPEDV